MNSWRRAGICITVLGAVLSLFSLFPSLIIAGTDSQIGPVQYFFILLGIVILANGIDVTRHASLHKNLRSYVQGNLAAYGFCGLGFLFIFLSAFLASLRGFYDLFITSFHWIGILMIASGVFWITYKMQWQFSFSVDIQEITGRIRSKWQIVVGILCILFPLFPLASLHSGFYVDWYNHVWLMGYYGQYFSVHHNMPSVLNTYEVSLLAYPLFYGYLFHALGGLISIFTGANLAVRLLFLFLWALKFGLVYQITKKLSEDKTMGIVLGCLVCWEIYPLTNLYNRSALTEAFAAGLVTCIFCSALLMIFESKLQLKIFYVLLTGLMIALSTEHPITLLSSVPFLGIMILAIVVPWIRSHKSDWLFFFTSFVAMIFFVLLVLSPWLYTTLSFMDQLHISNSNSPTFHFFAEDIDNIFTRFAPFPLDSRSLTNGTSLNTPFLDAQMNVPLLLFLIAFGWKSRANQSSMSATKQYNRIGRVLFWAALALFGLATVMSLSDYVYRQIPFLKIIQFPFRIITYQNIAVLAIVFSLLMLQRHFESRDMRLIVITLCLTLAGTGVLVKISHAMPIRDSKILAQFADQEQSFFGSIADRNYELNPSDKSAFLSLPHTMLRPSVAAFTMVFNQNTRIGASHPFLAFSVDKGDNFGVPLAKEVNLPTVTWVKTNVSSAPWVEMLLDGQRFPDLDVSGRTGFIFIKVPPGKHTIEARFSPPMIFTWLIRIRSIALILWGGAVLSWAFAVLRKSKASMVWASNGLG